MELEFIKGKADEYFDFMVNARRRLHRNPELSEKEWGTQKYIREIFDKEGIFNKSIAETGVLAVIKGGADGNTVGFRADMDALPIR